MAETLTHTDTHHDHNEGDAWDGGKQPFKASYGKLMMWYFLLSDAFTFAGFLIAYGALRIAMPSWPIADKVFSTFPGGFHEKPLYFVTLMTFILLFSSYTMVRAVQDGHREYKKGIVVWMFLTILGGLAFLGCQAWEWSTLIGKEHMTITKNPFGTTTEAGTYLDPELGSFEVGHSYLLHKYHAPHAAHDDHGHGHGHDDHAEDHAAGHDDEHHLPGFTKTDATYTKPGDYPYAVVNEDGFILHKYKVTSGEDAGKTKTETLGPKAFGALFFFITGFHGFHVFSGVVFLIIIMVNVASGLYVKRRNGYEMVEKIGLYWHFVDLVWVFVFLVFYLI